MGAGDCFEGVPEPGMGGVPFNDFRRRHVSHNPATLHPLGDGYAISDPPSELARVEYLEVTDGRDRFWVRSAWKHGTGPASYHLIPGCFPSSEAGTRRSRPV
ncbi:MAG TPA: hypothetical protein VGB25_06515 [Candidatus Binatia bacterium]